MGMIKQMIIKNRIYYFYDDMVNIKHFDPNLLKLDKRHPRILLFITMDMSQKKMNAKLVV